MQNLLRKQGKNQDFFPLSPLTIIKVVNKELQGKPAAVWYLSWVLSYSLPPLQSTEATFFCFPLVTYNKILALDFWEWKKLTYLLQPEFDISIGYRGQTIHTAPHKGEGSYVFSVPLPSYGTSWQYFMSVKSYLCQGTWVALKTGTKVSLWAYKQLPSPQFWFSLAAHASRNNCYLWFCSGWATCFRLVELILLLH